MKKQLYLVLLLLIFQGCATFKSNSDQSSILNNNTFRLNGNYSIFTKGFVKKPKAIQYENLFREIDRNNYRKDTLYINPTENYKLGIHILNEKSVALSYIKNNKVFRKRTLKAKFKKNGYLYLKNRNFKTKLIPYIFGRFAIKRTRIGINEENDLIFDASRYTGGAGFFIVGLNFDKNNYTLTYQRIDND